MQYPAPWNLQGRGFVFLCRPKKTEVPDLNASAGGLRWMMLVDYRESNAGPYRELLYIPGRVPFSGRRYHTITKIFVSTMDSVISGRENWGIPKELADFAFEDDQGICRAAATVDGVRAAEFSLRSRGVRFPVTTRLLPISLVQKQHQRYLHTAFFGSGLGRFVQVESFYADPDLFVPLEKQEILACIEVEPFRLVFPKARELKR